MKHLSLICLMICLACGSQRADAQDLILRNHIDTAIHLYRTHLRNWKGDRTTRVNNSFGFDSVTVGDNIDLQGVGFTGAFLVSNSSFTPAFRFYRTGSPAENPTTHFLNTADFQNDHFLKSADFTHGLFAKKMAVTGSVFSDTADFTYAYFGDDASFRGTDFGNQAHFVEAHFDSLADFSHCRFGRIAYFSALDFGDQAQLLLDSTRLPDTLDFSNNDYLPKKIDFSSAFFADDSPRHHIFLDRTDLSQLQLDYIHFRLLFKDPKNPNGSAVDADHITSTYEGLLANFKSKGQWDSYEALNQEYTDYKLSRMGFLNRLWYLYAASPKHVLLVTFAVFFLLATINVFFYRDLDTKVYTLKHFGPEAIAGKERHQIPFWRAWLLSALYTAIIFFTFSLKMDELHFNHKKLLIWFFVNYILGLIALFFLTHLLFH